MPKPKPVSKRALLLKVGLSIALFAAAAYVLVRNWHTVHSSLILARHASIPWLVLSLLLTLLTFCWMALSFGILALHKLRFGETLLVETSTAFVNRLLPSGLGSLGLNGVYLYKRKHTAAEATVIVSTNNLLGITVHLSLLTGVLLFYPHALHRFIDGRHWSIGWPAVLLAALIIGTVLALPVVRRRTADFVKSLLQSVRKFRWRQLALAALVGLCITTTFTTILWSTAHSLHIQLTLVQIFIVFSLGMLTSTATPTPGGLVGAEAGLFAGFVAYGVSSPTAGAVVLVFRLITYWLPLLPGALALLLARRLHLV